MKSRILSVVALLAGTFVAGQANAECGDVTIAEMNWPSAGFMAHLDGIILGAGYGCNVEIIPGDTVPTGTSMIEKGEPDIAPELWTNSFVDALNAAVEEGKLTVITDSLSDGGEEGWWVPKYLVDEHPELATIEGVKANAAMFEHPENPDKSGFYTCPSGWACQLSTRNEFAALDMESAGFELVDPGSAAGLDGSIARAYERELPWVGYYWAPTAILGKYEMVKVDFGVGVDEEHWQDCISQEVCEDPQPSMYPSSPVRTVATSEFAGSAPEAVEYLGNRSFTNADMNRILVWIDENQADGETAAVYYLENYEDVWTSWVSDDVADKVKAAIAAM